MTDTVWVDGRVVPAAEPQLFVTDRGFQLGDGVFETARARRGVVIELEEHLARLRESAAITARGNRYRHMVRVQIFLKNGTTLEKTVEAPRGSEAHFASDADVIEKFRKLASRRIPDAQVAQVIDLVMNAERMPQAGALVKAISVTH